MPDVFKDVLSSNESLFADEMALDQDYLPKEIPHRENQQHYIADCIKPLFQKREGKNLLIMGSPGIGKTAAVRWVLRELEEKGLDDQVYPIYVNCWKKDTPYKIALDICEQIGFTFVHNKDTSELFKEIQRILNKKGVAICFDECDKVQDLQAFYTVLTDILRKTLVFITNDNKWLSTIDKRVTSRLLAEVIEFKPYTAAETRDILKRRAEHAFVPNAFEKEAFDAIVEKTVDGGDIRIGLYLLRESGTIAEGKSFKKITRDHVKKAIEKLEDFHSKSTLELDQEQQTILALAKENNGKTTMQIYSIYKGRGGTQSYSNFQRKIKYLEKNKFIRLEEVNEGSPGRSTKVYYGNTQLTDFSS